MKLYLKSGQVVKIDEVRCALSSKGKDYVDYDENEIPRLEADRLLEDACVYENDCVIEFYGQDDCLKFTTSIKQISGIEE